MGKTMIAFIALVAGMMAAVAQPVTVTSTRVLVDSCAYFPQLSADGTQLLFSNTEASVLSLNDLATGRVTTVADQGLPGFDARFGPDGKVYYVTQRLGKGNRVYREGHCYNPVTGRSERVLKPQHGPVDVLTAQQGVAIVGTADRFATDKQMGLYAYTRRSQLFVVDGDRQSVSSPAGECAGYLWATVSPGGTMVVLEAAGKGLFVCDLAGNVLHRLPAASMPVWLDDGHIIAMTNTNFGAQRDKGTYLYVTTLDGQTQLLTDPEEHAVQPMVVGDRLVYVADGGQVKEATLQWTRVENARPGAQPQWQSVPREKASDAVRVFINPGHGGHDSNDRPTPYYSHATGDTTAYYESDSNFKKGMALKQILEAKGYEVEISRYDNKTEDDLDLFEISALANHSGADKFLAIHSNATGIERKLNFPLALYRGWSGEPCVAGSDSIARCIMRHLEGNHTTVWTHPSRIYGDWTFYPNWGYKTGLGVLRYNKLPGMLSEGSFHDYLAERRRLNNDDFCWLEGWNFSVAIDEYFGRKGTCATGVVAGRVTDLMTDSPYEGYKFGPDIWQARNGVTVYLENQQGEWLVSAMTDGMDNGFYLLRDVKPGQYRVVCIDGGDDSRREMRDIYVRPNATTYCNFAY